MLVLRRKSFAKAPLKMLGKAMLGTFRSSSFLAVFIMIYQGPSTPFPTKIQLTESSGRSALPEDPDARGIRGGRVAEGDAGASEEKGELLVDWVRDVFQLVRGGKGESPQWKNRGKGADSGSLCRNEGQS